MVLFTGLCVSHTAGTEALGEP